MKESTNKGFTLVELIVAIAILAFLLIGLGMFMTTGSRLYAKVYYKQEMLTESQLLMAQVNDRVIDCNAGIAWDQESNILYVVQKSEETSAILGTDTTGETTVSYVIHQYKLVGDEMFYKSITKTETAWGNITDIETEFANVSDEYAKLAEYVETFDVGLNLDATGSIITSVEVTTGFSQGGEDYEGNQLIYMRNQPTISMATSESGEVVGDIDGLMDKLIGETGSSESGVDA